LGPSLVGEELCLRLPTLRELFTLGRLHGESLGSLGPSLVGEELGLRLPTLRELYTLGRLHGESLGSLGFSEGRSL